MQEVNRLTDRMIGKLVTFFGEVNRKNDTKIILSVVLTSLKLKGKLLNKHDELPTIEYRLSW